VCGSDKLAPLGSRFEPKAGPRFKPGAETPADGTVLSTPAPAGEPEADLA
jgi:hypothetical protein